MTLPAPAAATLFCMQQNTPVDTRESAKRACATVADLLAVKLTRGRRDGAVPGGASSPGGTRSETLSSTSLTEAPEFSSTKQTKIGEGGGATPGRSGAPRARVTDEPSTKPRDRSDAASSLNWGALGERLRWYRSGSRPEEEFGDRSEQGREQRWWQVADVGYHVFRR